MARREGLFARLSLDYADHPKIAVLSSEAFRAHVEMILYSRRYMTDGVIAKQIAKRWLESALQELLSNDDEAPSLLELNNGDYLLHGFSDMQETKQEIEAKRQVRAEAGRKGGLKAKQNVKREPSKSSSKQPSNLLSKNEAETELETELETEVIEPSKSQVASDPRPDVDELLDLLDAEIEANGNKTPNRTKANMDSIRLLIDRDQYTTKQIRYVIGWCQQDNFWKSNILSPRKLREKFPQLVARIKSEAERPSGRDQPRNRAQERMDNNKAVIEELRRLEEDVDSEHDTTIQGELL